MTSKPSGSVSWFQVFQRGQHYMKTSPSDKRLAPVFPENRVARATRFAIRFMPPLAIFTLTADRAGRPARPGDRHRAVRLQPADAGLVVAGAPFCYAAAADAAAMVP